MGFNTPEDIANRALQHCGVPPSNRISSLTESTKNAKECALAYHKLREAELRRQTWGFSIRHAVLRPVDTDTKIYLPPVYASGTTYAVGDIVKFTDPVDNSARLWLSTQASNTGNTPTAGSPWANYFGPVAAGLHDTSTAYFAGEIVYDDSNNVWISLVSGNANSLTEGANWHELSGGTLQALTLLFPIGSGPSSQSTTRNVFRLPNGFLREAPQDPKAGSRSFLGAPSGIAYADWLFEGDYIVSSQSDAIMLRFAADWTDVTTMNALFCEALAARLAYELCEPLTQSTAKAQMITAEYQKAMGEARIVDAIEQGAEEPPLDDYVVCRA